MYPPTQQQNPYGQQKPEPTFWDSLGLVPKIIIILGVILLVTTLLFGFSISNIGDFIFAFIRVAVAIGLIFFALSSFMQRMQKKSYSPTEDFRTKVVGKSRLLKPPNVYRLWLRGEGMRSRALIGNIEGLGWIPYLSAKAKTNEKGEIIYCKDLKGKEILNKEGLPIPEYQLIENGDGDTIFVVKQGFLGLGDPLTIRCHPNHHSEVIGDIYIKDVGLAPFGEWFYPSKQWSGDVERVQMQNKLEAIMSAYFKSLDLAQTATEMSIAIDPWFSKILATRNEELARAPAPFQQQQGGGIYR